MRSVSVAAFVVSTAVSGVAMLPSDAGAATIYRSISVLSCSVHNHDAYWGDSSLANPQTTGMFVGCAVPNDSDLWHTNVDSASDSIRVKGYQWGADKAQVAACYANFTSTGGGCSAYVKDSSGAGYYDLRPSSATWRGSGNGYNFPYVIVWLDACSPGTCTMNTTTGIWFRGTQTQP